MTDYISPILGEIPEDIYSVVANTPRLPYTREGNVVPYRELLNRIKREYGYGRLRTDILYIETEFDDVREFIGAELNALLLSRGVASTNAVNLVRLFAANQTLIDDLIEKGFSTNEAVYELDLKGRLRELGLTTRILTTSFAFDSVFNVYPVIEKPELVPPPPPPPEYEYWRPFGVSMLIDCETRQDNRKITRKVEFRGIFTALKEAIVDWKKIEAGGRCDEDTIGKAVEVAEDILSEYSRWKGYDFLFECSEPTFNGCNLMEDSPDIEVLVDDSDIHETTAFLEVVDIDYSKSPFSDSIVFKGKWWLDKDEAIKTLRRQVSQGVGAGQYAR